MNGIKALAYVGIGAKEPDAWCRFGTEVLGMQVGEPPTRGSRDAVHLRTDERAHRVVIESGEDGAVHYLGFEAGSLHDLVALVSRLRSSGLDVVEEGAEIRAERRVSAMYSTRDQSGNRVELVVGHETSAHPFLSPLGTRFVVGDMGMGHAFMFVDSSDAFVDFYVNKLGFKVSDTTGLGGNDAYFLHCNPRHHSVAGVSVPGERARLQHIMLEVDSIDAVGIAFDRALTAGFRIEGTIGRHTNDHMVSFMCTTPSGLSLEYGTGGRRIDDSTWVVGHYTRSSSWGHARPGHDIRLERISG